jgi:hypothetical protein
MGGACSTTEENRNAYRILVGKPEGKGPLGKPRRRWVNNIKMDLREIGWDDVDWIDLVEDIDQWRALVNTVLNLRVPRNTGSSLVAVQLAAPQKGLSSVSK